MRLAHIRRGEIIRQYTEEKGKILCENGDVAMPPQAGYVNGDDKVVPVEQVTSDTSTGPDTVTTRDTTVEADRVLATTTIRDMTPQEIADRDDARTESRIDEIKTAILYAAERAGDDITQASVREAAFDRARQIYKALNS